MNPITPQPQQPNLAPTPFPASLINIVNPPNAPDPTAMASAMSALAAPGIFRDMSGTGEVAGLLKTLSDNSVKIAETAAAVRGGTSPAPGDGSSTTAGSANTTPSGVATTQKSTSSGAEDTSAAEKKKIETEGARLEVAKANLPPKEQAEVRAVATKNLTSAPPTTAVKTFVFKAKDYRNMDLEFALGVRVVDNRDRDSSGSSTKVLDSKFIRAGSTQVTFKEVDPIIDVQVDVDPVEIDFGVMKYTIPKIRLTTDSSIQIKGTQSLVQVMIRQSARVVDIEEESLDKAATSLADKYGGELGFDKVVAGKLLAEQAKQETVEKSGKIVKKYSLNLPGGAFTLTVI